MDVSREHHRHVPCDLPKRGTWGECHVEVAEFIRRQVSRPGTHASVVIPVSFTEKFALGLGVRLVRVTEPVVPVYLKVIFVLVLVALIRVFANVTDVGVSDS